MNKIRQQKELNRRYGKMAESMSAYYHHLDLRPLDELDDEAFAYIMPNVKGVNMLDLNETMITNESIKYLGRLEYVYELRCKGCHFLDNDCITDLNKLSDLVFLHLNHTGITIDGLLGLTGLNKLHTLLFTGDVDSSFAGKMLQLKIAIPDCEFVVNSKPYGF
jgi:hypothetical protein